VLITNYYSLARKHRKHEILKRVMAGPVSSSNDTADENIELPFVSFEDIAAATDNFSDSKQIGRGGFGKVYQVTKKFYVQSCSSTYSFFKDTVVLLSSFHN
jgi:hypothetical protein